MPRCDWLMRFFQLQSSYGVDAEENGEGVEGVNLIV